MKIETQADVERLMMEQGIAIHFRPIISEQPGGTWIARYPCASWFATGSDANDARERLREEGIRHMPDPANAEWKVEAVRRYYADGPLEGVYIFDKETADRIFATDATTEALDNEIAAIDRRRAENGEGVH
ncbi:hypothetical protein QN239_31065 [Mycolicibacterium sp. Y3]